MSVAQGPIASETSGLLVDTNLLVLFTVGSVNVNRIGTFKRTNKYTIEDFDLLVRVLGRFKTLYTLAHVLSEVSNLTDLPGLERQRARQVLKRTIAELTESEISSFRASEDASFPKLGLVDAAISAVARQRKCTVLTDDLDLYLSLARDRVSVLNFAHLQASSWGL